MIAFGFFSIFLTCDFGSLNDFRRSDGTLMGTKRGYKKHDRYAAGQKPANRA
jgi:hypothetical protein